MSYLHPLVLCLLLVSAVVPLGYSRADAFACLGDNPCIIWPSGRAPLKFFLGAPNGALSNGTFSFDENAIHAANDWNNLGSRFRFEPAVGGTFVNPCGAQGPQHACNNTGPIDDNPVDFSPTICGQGFGDALALTINCFDPRAADMVNAPVFFNSNLRWDAYDGALRSGSIDIRRVLLHEFGHVLGLDHPNQNGQQVVAMMNSNVSNLDRLQADDINGLFAIYGGGGPVVSDEPGGCAVSRGRGTANWLLLPLSLFALCRCAAARRRQPRR